MKFRTKVFYFLKPLIPRFVQILIRRKRSQRSLRKNNNNWPIDLRVSRLPEKKGSWKDGKDFCFVLVHDVETQIGYKHCTDLLKIDHEMGFRASFNFVPERYKVESSLLDTVRKYGYEIGVHGLKHDGKLFLSQKRFSFRAEKINRYIEEWKAVGFYSPSMHHNLDMILDLNIDYDQSTFDTDPFEPQPGGVGSIFPFIVSNGVKQQSYVELPYTMPQDHTLFIILGEKNNDIWKRKLDWLAQNRGMVLLKTHPDYMDFEDTGSFTTKHYPVSLYIDILDYIKKKYSGSYWHALPREVSVYWKSRIAKQ